MALNVDIFKNNTYTVMQVCELLRRTTIMLNRMIPDHGQVNDLIGFSVVSKFADTLVWMLDCTHDDAKVIIKLSLKSHESDMAEVIQMWRDGDKSGHTKESYRDRMTASSYRNRPKLGRNTRS